MFQINGFTYCYLKDILNNKLSQLPNKLLLALSYMFHELNLAETL